MIQRVYYDDYIHPACEEGWRRFLSDVVVRSADMIRQFCQDVDSRGLEVIPQERKDWEVVRRQSAAFCWVFAGTGGDFSFDRVCQDLDISPDRVRARILRACRVPRDIHRVVSVVSRERERRYGEQDCQPDPVGPGMGTRLDAALGCEGLHGPGDEGQGAGGSAAVHRQEKPDAVGR